jgi:hypothetical protein
VGIVLLMAYFVVGCLLLFYSLVVLWPAPTPAGGAAPGTEAVKFLFWTFSVTDEARLLLLVALGGALGTLVHALRSFYWYVGNRKLVQSWVAMYLLLPFSGTSLALAFYLVIRGGFFSPQATVQQTSPFGFVALAVLVGMFSQQAVLKLKEVAETVLTRPNPGEDNQPQESTPVVLAAPSALHLVATGATAAPSAAGPGGNGAAAGAGHATTLPPATSGLVIGTIPADTDAASPAAESPTAPLAEPREPGDADAG